MKNSKEYASQYRIKNRDHILELAREWYHNHPTARFRFRQRQKNKFGVERPTWWLCDLCNKPIAGFDIKLDHDHITGKFRGWLCNDCNAKLGWLENRLSLLPEYLLRGMIQQ